jgi:hypothetical protein
MKARGRLAACSRSLPAPHPACSVWFHGPGFPHSWRGRLAKPRVDGATGGALQPAVVTALLSPPCLPFKAMKCHPWGRQDPNKAPAWLLGHELWAEAGSERHRQSKPDGSFWPAPSREAAWPCSGSQCAHGFLLRLGDLPKSSRGLQLAQVQDIEMGVCSPGQGQGWGGCLWRGHSTVEQELCPVGSMVQHSSTKRWLLQLTCVQ